MNDKKFQRIYRDAPRDLADKLLRFRSTHTPRQLEVNDVRWTYFSSGGGEESLVLLPGATGVAEQPFLHIMALEENFRVIAPDYPPVPAMADLVEGVSRIMDAEGVKAANILGGSYGGLVAQCFIRKQPEKVLKLVLSHTSIPRPERARTVKRMGAIFGLVPAWLLRAAFKKEVRKQLKQFPEEGGFWTAYFKEIISNLKKADFRNMVKRVVDLMENYSFRPEDFADWKGRILIINSDDDPMAPADVQAALMELYPAAETYVFHGTGHTTSVIRPEEYLAVVKEFLGRG